MKSPNPNSSQKKLARPGSVAVGGDPTPAQLTVEPWLDDACVLDMDNFAKTLYSIKAKGIRPDHLGSIISHYASKWLPELSDHEATAATPSPQSTMASWLKKRFFVETLVGMLPAEKDAVQCDFLLRLIRAASMVGAGPVCMAELEARTARQLEQATLKELMIPAFSHTSETLLDVGLVLRLVRRFVRLDEAAAAVKVAKLVDSYLAEAALDAGLTVSGFEELARALPGHVRATDDGLYRAVDTYIKAHPSTTKQERKSLFRLVDTRKLSSEAFLHAAQNERLPVRSVIQVLFSEHAKLNRMTEWSGSFSGTRSSNPDLEALGRVLSKREVLAQQQEMRRLRDDVVRLQLQCHTMQAQIDRLTSKKKMKGLFKWTCFLFRSTDVVEKMKDYEVGAGRQTPMDVNKARLVQERATPPKQRNSMQ